MRKVWAMVVIAAALAGCGGSGGSSEQSNQPMLIRAAGAWDSGAEGVLQIQPNGEFNGQVLLDGESRHVVGTIEETGEVLGTVWDGQTQRALGGQLMLTSQDHLVGELVKGIPGDTWTYPVDLARKESP